jgi:hypothetical protein
MSAKKKTPQQPDPPKKRVPLGKGLHWSDAELDAMSVVTPADIEAAKRRVESEPGDLATFLGARPIDIDHDS